MKSSARVDKTDDPENVTMACKQVEAVGWSSAGGANVPMKNRQMYGRGRCRWWRTMGTRLRIAMRKGSKDVCEENEEVLKMILGKRIEV